MLLLMLSTSTMTRNLVVRQETTSSPIFQILLSQRPTFRSANLPDLFYSSVLKCASANCWVVLVLSLCAPKLRRLPKCSWRRCNSWRFFASLCLAWVYRVIFHRCLSRLRQRTLDKWVSLWWQRRTTWLLHVRCLVLCCCITPLCSCPVQDSTNLLPNTSQNYLVQSSIQVDNDLASTVIIDDLELANVSLAKEENTDQWDEPAKTETYA